VAGNRLLSRSAARVEPRLHRQTSAWLRAHAAARVECRETHPKFHDSGALPGRLLSRPEWRDVVERGCREQYQEATTLGVPPEGAGWRRGRRGRPAEGRRFPSARRSAAQAASARCSAGRVGSPKAAAVRCRRRPQRSATRSSGRRRQRRRRRDSRSAPPAGRRAAAARPAFMSVSAPASQAATGPTREGPNARRRPPWPGGGDRRAAVGRCGAPEHAVATWQERLGVGEDVSGRRRRGTTRASRTPCRSPRSPSGKQADLNGARTASRRSGGVREAHRSPAVMASMRSRRVREADGHLDPSVRARKRCGWRRGCARFSAGRGAAGGIAGSGPSHGERPRGSYIYVTRDRKGQSYLPDRRGG
jgi:hypothetical protein